MIILSQSALEWRGILSQRIRREILTKKIEWNSNKEFFASKVELMEEELQSGRQRLPAMDGGWQVLVPPEEGQTHFAIKHES